MSMVYKVPRVCPIPKNALEVSTALPRLMTTRFTCVNPVTTAQLEAPLLLNATLESIATSIS